MSSWHNYTSDCNNDNNEVNRSRSQLDTKKSLKELSTSKKKKKFVVHGGEHA